FIARALRETGIRLEIINSEEEARLAVIGCYSLLPPGDEPALIFDIGGGSTELVFVDTTQHMPRILNWCSLPWGVVNLTEVTSGVDGPVLQRMQAYAAMRRRVRDSIGTFASTMEQKTSIRLLGTSGTVTTLGGVYLGLETYDRRKVDGLKVPLMSMRAICQHLSGLSLAERAEIASIGLDRADLVVAGCAILEEILKLWPARELCIADRGIREGMLLRLMAHKTI
ncbi:MAG: Ppx/GppA family phosphatase, partial [Alphaproteobacteria bacterium]|nr:Ppx/GppA family phosphatase [Alphaproteobacteria bacterium]